MKKYYIYKIEFPDLTYYIGYRGTAKPVNEDFLVKYFSSSRIVKERINDNEEYQGTVIAQGLDKETAYNKEQEIIHNHINDPLCLNQVCYYGRNGFGILSEEACKKNGVVTRERWQDPEYKARLVAAHKKRWQDNPELKHRQSKRLKGKKRPEHSAKLTGRPGHTKCKGVKKPKGHGANVSRATLGVPKSEAHKQSLRGPKPRVCRLTDRKEMSVNHYTRWIKSIFS